MGAERTATRRASPFGWHYCSILSDSSRRPGCKFDAATSGWLRIVQQTSGLDSGAVHSTSSRPVPPLDEFRYLVSSHLGAVLRHGRSCLQTVARMIAIDLIGIAGPKSEGMRAGTEALGPSCSGWRNSIDRLPAVSPVKPGRRANRSAKPSTWRRCRVVITSRDDAHTAG